MPRKVTVKAEPVEETVEAAPEVETVPCDDCGGTGLTQPLRESLCPACEGSGKVTKEAE